MVTPRQVAASAAGIDANRLVDLLDALDADTGIEPHGLIVQRHGHRVVDARWAPHTADRSRLVYSLSKSFTSTALALAIGEGRLALDDRVFDHLPDAFVGVVDGPTLDIRIRHIASMSTGHDHEMLAESFAADPDDPVRGLFHLPPQHEPGSVFAYSQPPVLALATILQRLVGQPLSEYLRPRLLDPLGITDFAWRRYRTGVEPGFSGVFTTLDAIADLGQLLLDDGVVEGRRLLPEGWVAEASRPQVANPGEPNPDWQQGYGFGMWMSRHGYRGDGAFGQLMLVLPEHDAVVAAFTHAIDMQSLLDHIWSHLLPAFDVTATAADDAALSARIASLSLPTAARRLDGTTVAALEGAFTPGDRRPTTHRTVTRVDAKGDHLVIHERGEAAFAITLSDEWSTASNPPTATSACRTADGQVAVDLAFLATPHRLEIRLDPSTRTFSATWPAMPLFGAGLDPTLATMDAPSS